jgi:hypothetical protein
MNNIWIKKASGWVLAQTFTEKEKELPKGWLGEISKEKPVDAMMALPENVTDPFVDRSKRLRNLIDLYRQYDRKRLFEWAQKQSGLSDPLSRFTRDELQDMFKKYEMNRDRELLTLLNTMSRKGENFDQEMKDVPLSVEMALRNMGWKPSGSSRAQIQIRRSWTLIDGTWTLKQG